MYLARRDNQKCIGKVQTPPAKQRKDKPTKELNLQTISDPKTASNQTLFRDDQTSRTKTKGDT